MHEEWRGIYMKKIIISQEKKTQQKWTPTLGDIKYESVDF